MKVTPDQSHIYVIGHLKPDTDAICSAIGHAAFLRMTGEQNAMAVRCGDVPERTAWVLSEAGVEEPPLVTDLRMRARHICRRDVIMVRQDDTFLTAYRCMLDSGVRSVPVVNEEKEILGILKFLDLLQLLLPQESATGLSVRIVVASLLKIAGTLQASSCGAAMGESLEEEELIMLVGASSTATVRNRLLSATDLGNVTRYLVICGDRPSVQREAIEKGVRCLIVTGGFDLSDELKQLAKEKEVVVLTCEQDTASVAKLIRCSRTIRHALEGKFSVIDDREVVSDFRQRMTQSNQELFPVVKSGTRKVLGVISKSDLVDPPRTRVVLVDHNEYSQAAKGVEEVDIVEVIDHHRLGGNLVSREPIRVLNEPVGSTSTLVARKYSHRDLVPEKGVALCLCAGIISDTLNLSSPTTTDLDKTMLKWLSEIAEIDAQKFMHEFFAIGSLLAHSTTEQVLNTDRKEFTESGKSITIAQVEEVGLEQFKKRRDDLQNALEDLARDNKYDLAVLVITDITKHFSLVLAVGEELLVNSLPYHAYDEGGLFEAPGVVSRKKQVFPTISKAVQRVSSVELDSL